MIEVLLAVGVAWPVGFVVGWVSAESASGRVSARVLWDRQERRHERERAALIAAVIGEASVVEQNVAPGSAPVSVGGGVRGE